MAKQNDLHIQRPSRLGDGATMKKLTLRSKPADCMLDRQPMWTSTGQSETKTRLVSTSTSSEPHESLDKISPLATVHLSTSILGIYQTREQGRQSCVPPPC